MTSRLNSPQNAATAVNQQDEATQKGFVFTKRFTTELNLSKNSRNDPLDITICLVSLLSCGTAGHGVLVLLGGNELSNLRDDASLINVNLDAKWLSPLIFNITKETSEKESIRVLSNVSPEALDGGIIM